MMKEKELELVKAVKENEKIPEIPGVASKIAQLQEETLKINTLASGKPVPVNEGKQNRDLVFNNNQGLGSDRQNESSLLENYKSDTLRDGAEIEKLKENVVPNLNIKKKIVKTMH